MNHTSQHRRLGWWLDDPSNPGRASLDNPSVQRLIAEISPGARVTDLGGTMSLNVLVDPPGLVLRVHQPFVSRRRLLAVQQVRRWLARQGLTVAVARTHRGSTVFRCGDRWAELEPYLPHEKPGPSLPSYSWMFGAMGQLHRALNVLPQSVPRPLVATYAPPGSLRRWLAFTRSVVHDREAEGVLRRAHELLQRLRRQWVPADQLPRQLVHGDVRLGNISRSPIGEVVYLDFGFMAVRPRVHELAYSIAFMLLALDAHRDPARFDWQSVPQLIAAYDSAAGHPLQSREREALSAYTAAVPLYFTACAGYTRDPIRELRTHAPFLEVSAWLLGPRSPGRRRWESETTAS